MTMANMLSASVAGLQNIKHTPMYCKSNCIRYDKTRHMGMLTFFQPKT